MQRAWNNFLRPSFDGAAVIGVARLRLRGLETVAANSSTLPMGLHRPSAMLHVSSATFTGAHAPRGPCGHLAVRFEDDRAVPSTGIDSAVEERPAATQVVRDKR